MKNHKYRKTKVGEHSRYRLALLGAAALITLSAPAALLEKYEFRPRQAAMERQIVSLPLAERRRLLTARWTTQPGRKPGALTKSPGTTARPPERDSPEHGL